MARAEKTIDERLESNLEWWEDRQIKTQQRLTDKSIAETEQQLSKYYLSAQEKIIGQFELTYNKILSRTEEGKNPTPADLYKLDTYWQMQAQLKAELEKLGNKETELLNRKFIEQFQQIYESIALKDNLFFGTIDYQTAQKLINSIWCADGQTWSKRVWGSTSKLQQALNDSLLDCLITGRNPRYLKEQLMRDFNVGYKQADTLVRTEMAHIQTTAAQERYKNAGVKEVEIMADYDERRCDICADLHQKRYPIDGKIPIPAHPRCRCCIKPVIERNKVEQEKVVQQATERRSRREGYSRKVAPMFETMNKKEIVDWSKTNISTSIDFSGAGETATRATVKAIYNLEQQGIDLNGISIKYGKTGSSYGLFSRSTKTLYLRGNDSYVEQMKETDLRCYAKYGKPYYASSSYEGTLYHELGHALDDLLGHKLTQGIASNDKIYEQSLKVSFYSSVRPHDIRANKATETFAECFSAYMTNSDRAKFIPIEVIEWIKKYLTK